MEKQKAAVSNGNDAVGRMQFFNQMKVLDAYVEFLLRHEFTFNPRHGDQLLHWIERSGSPAITIFVLEEAYQHLRGRAPAEPEIPPTIISQPKSVEAEPLELVTFSVVAQGSCPLEYQWLVCGGLTGLQPIPGEHSKRPSYSTVATEYSDENLYCCRISNKFGTIVSSSARLTMK